MVGRFDEYAAHTPIVAARVATGYRLGRAVRRPGRVVLQSSCYGIASPQRPA